MTLYTTEETQDKFVFQAHSEIKQFIIDEFKKNIEADIKVRYLEKLEATDEEIFSVGVFDGHVIFEDKKKFWNQSFRVDSVSVDEIKEYMKEKLVPKLISQFTEAA
ncbi:MAG: hypothetical protein V4629_02945 [Pseudomonadota bacterium]